MRRITWLTSLFRRAFASTTSQRRAMPRSPARKVPQPAEQLESRELLAVFSVRPNVADGAGGSLRAAIQNANKNHADDTIQLAPGRYVLSLGNSASETKLGARGDLDVTESGKTLVLQGSGMDSTILDAAGLDRVLEAHPGVTLVLRDLTLTGGNADQGGGLFADQANLVLDNVAIRDNVASEGGGLFLSNSDVTIRGSRIERNLAKGEDGETGLSAHTGSNFDDFYDWIWSPTEGTAGADSAGGGILLNSGSLRVTNSVITDNVVQGGRGGDGGSGGQFWDEYADEYVILSTGRGGNAGAASGGVQDMAFAVPGFEVADLDRGFHQCAPCSSAASVPM